MPPDTYTEHKNINHDGDLPAMLTFITNFQKCIGLKFKNTSNKMYKTFQLGFN